MALSLILRHLRRTLARAVACAALAGLAALPGASAAEPVAIPGAAAPELVTAIDHWLESDEETALAALAELAQDGNSAARLLLAMIDKTPALQGPWLAHLSREERIALLRQPGGLSGRNWLHAIAEEPLAAAWIELLQPPSGLEVLETFTALGEPRAAREALIILAAREHPALSRIAPESVDPDLLYLLWRGADDDRRAELLALLPPESPQRALIEGTMRLDALQDWLASSAAGAPLDAVCATLCSDTRATCLSGAYKALASHNALLTLGSPVETLIPQEDFLAHPRGRESVLRRILQTHDARGRRALIAQMRDHDACLSEVLDAEAARYRYRRPGSDSSNGG